MFDFSSPGRFIYFFIAIGIILIIFFRILRYFLPYRLRSKKSRMMVQKYLSFFEYLIWIFFLVYSLNKFYTQDRIVSIVILIFLVFLIVLFNWYYVRDYVAGVVFKHSSGIHQGDLIQISDYTGKVTRFGVRSLILENEKGETIAIPYNQIVHQAVHRISISESVKSYSFNLTVKREQDIIQTIQYLREYIMSLSWSSVKHSPGIKLLEEKKDLFVFEVTVYSLLDDYTYKIEQDLKSKFE